MYFKPVSLSASPVSLSASEAWLFASVLWVLGTTGANADGRITLTSADLDDVTAVASYAPAQVGKLREAADDATSELDRLRREVVEDINRETGNDLARPRATGDRVVPAMVEPSPRPAAGMPASPARPSVSTSRSRVGDAITRRAATSETAARARRSGHAAQAVPRAFAGARPPVLALDDRIVRMRSEAARMPRALADRSVGAAGRFSSRP